MENKLIVKLNKKLTVGKNEDGSYKEIEELSFRDITAGDIRGLSIKELLVDLKSDAWLVLLPRICEQNINASAFATLNVLDFTNIIAKVAEQLEK